MKRLSIWSALTLLLSAPLSYPTRQQSQARDRSKRPFLARPAPTKAQSLANLEAAEAKREKRRQRNLRNEQRKESL